MITTAQIRYLHLLLRKSNLIGQKATLISSFSKGRTESCKGLLFEEAGALIQLLEKQIPLNDRETSANQMRRKIIGVFHKIGWEKYQGEIDMERVNFWCKNKSYLKKELQKYTPEELPKLVSQVHLVYNYFLEHL
jgi:hypothetical protein